ncbi:MAG: hypothetical protein M1823_006597, partial [Watsoniomyces obsoletus]
MLDKYNIKASWYIPAHTIESFPQQMAKVRDAGHEIGLHGYTHEFVSQLSTQQERDVLQKSIDTVTNFTGKRPKGWTAPAWTASRQTITLLEEFGIEYDHSFMHHDCQMYWLPYVPESMDEAHVASPKVLDRRGVLGLAEVGGAGEKRHAAVGEDHEALEEAEAEGVVARQPIHALLLEQEHRVEPLAGHGGEQRLAAAGEFDGGEMQGHGCGSRRTIPNTKKNSTNPTAKPPNAAHQVGAGLKLVAPQTARPAAST